MEFKLGLTMFKKLCFICITLISSSLLQAQTNMQNKANLDLVKGALTEMFDQSNASLVDEYYRDDYRQHSPSIKDGKAGLVSAIKGMKDNNVSIKRDIIRTLAEGDLVYIQSRVSFAGGPSKVVVDLFKLNKGKIVEHWDVVQDEIPKAKSVNGNSMLDGLGNANRQVSNQYLENNKQVVKDFIEKGFAGDVTLLDSLFGEEYIQHNPYVPNGKEAVLGFLKNGGFVADIKQIIAQGDLVSVLVEYGRDGDKFHNACADLFRLDTNSKVVEHWDTCMSMPDESEFAHENGMF